MKKLENRKQKENYTLSDSVVTIQHSALCLSPFSHFPNFHFRLYASRLSSFHSNLWPLFGCGFAALWDSVVHCCGKLLTFPGLAISF